LNICFICIAFSRTFPQVAQNLIYGAALSHVAALFTAPDAFPTGRGVFSVRVTSVSFET
jgi:hypothetical protein